jgi:hypothetical protein
MVQLSVGSQLVAIPGAVVRVESGGFGVRFDPLTPDLQAAVDALVAEATPKADDSAPLEEQLAEARGVIEAYEQTLAALREAEVQATQRAEADAFEKNVLAEHLREMETKMKAQLAENARLVALLRQSETRLAALEREVPKREPPKTDESAAATIRSLQAKLAEREAQEVLLKQRLEDELKTMRLELAKQPDVARLREEMRELSSMLDDERLKSMAMQRALERFVAMGGTIPGQTEPNRRQ